MTIYQIRIKELLWDALDLSTSSYLNKKEAVDAVSMELVEKKIDFYVEMKGDKTRFLNDSGREIVAVIPI